MPKIYQSSKAFRAALEDRLKQRSLSEHIDITRLRRKIAFDRLLARLFTDSDPLWLLKGGYALELRLQQKARTTRDIDLSIPYLSRIRTQKENSAEMAILHEKLQEHAEMDLSDWFIYHIGAPMHDLENAPYGGARFPVEALLDQRMFAVFHLDIGIGDSMTASPEWLTGENSLEFAGIAPCRMATIPKEQQFAEKIHAYTLPRGEHINSRVKDLIDMLLLIDLGLPEASSVKLAIQATFQRRNTHSVPAMLEPPPQDWLLPYQSLAQECGFLDLSLEHGYNRLINYWQLLFFPHPEKRE